MMKERKGFTLLETVIAAGVFLLLTLLASNILLYASDTANALLIRQELLENARIAMDSMITNVQMAKSIELERGEDGSLRRLTLTEYQPFEGVDHRYSYVYFGENAARYHLLEFGENELAKYLSRVAADISGDTMTIEIITDERVDSFKSKAEAVTLKGAVSVRHKEIRFVE